MSISAQSSKDNSSQLSCLLFSLPAELRTEIYDYVLPPNGRNRIIQAGYGGLRWLCASPRLFTDVAPLIYGRGGFATLSKLGGETDIAGDFQNHLLKTYGRENLPWTSYFARRALKRIEVDINVPDFP